jgi:hypothetical protein
MTLVEKKARFGGLLVSLVQPACLQFPLLDPELVRDLAIITPNLLDEPLRVLAPDEHLELDVRELRE